jgi:hypothetical protein
MKNSIFIACILNICLLQVPLYAENSKQSPTSMSMYDRHIINHSYKTSINVELAKLRALQEAFANASSWKSTFALGALGTTLAAIGLIVPIWLAVVRAQYHSVQLKSAYAMIENNFTILHRIGLGITTIPWIAAAINYLLNEACASLERNASI